MFFNKKIEPVKCQHSWKVLKDGILKKNFSRENEKNIGEFYHPDFKKPGEKFIEKHKDENEVFYMIMVCERCGDNERIQF